MTLADWKLWIPACIMVTIQIHRNKKVAAVGIPIARTIMITLLLDSTAETNFLNIGFITSTRPEPRFSPSQNAATPSPRIMTLSF